MTISLSFAGLALAAQLLPAPAETRWENIATQGRDTVDIDPSSIAREGEVATAVLRVAVGPGTMQDGVALLVVRQAMNCRTRQIAVMLGDSYGEDGRFISSVQAPGELAYGDPPPGPDTDRLYRRMCGNPAA